MNRYICTGVAARFFIGVLAVIGLSVGPASQSLAFGVPDTASANPAGGEPNAAQHGEELFGRTCQQCHSTRGHGGKCPQLVRGAWAPGGANSDQLMFETISKGRPNTQMGAFGEILSEEEIRHIIIFLREESVRVQAEDANKPENPEEDLFY